MRRREWMRVLAGSALAGMPGCAVFPWRGGEEAGTYELPGRAIDHLRRHAAGGYVCRQGDDFISAGGSRAPFPVLSVTKAVTALMTARAVTNDWIKPDEMVDFPEWRGRPAVSVRQLIHSCSGLPAGDRELYSARPGDKGRAVLRLPQSCPPGRVFRYGPSSWEALGEFMKRKLPEHGTTLPVFLGETLGELAIRPADWRRDGLGTPYLSTGLVCGLDDLARLGAALADLSSGRGGAGVSAGVFADLTAPCRANPMFSAGIWWNRRAVDPLARAVEPERSLRAGKPPGFWKAACLHPRARPGWFALVGSGGTRVYVEPASRVVIAVARAGGGWRDSAMLAVC